MSRHVDGGIDDTGGFGAGSPFRYILKGGLNATRVNCLDHLNSLAVPFGCNQKTADQANRFKTMAADCKKDDDCAKGFICTEKKCTKGNVPKPS